MEVKIVNVDEKNFDLVPRPANRRFNCKECFYWVGKQDGRLDLERQKKRWMVRTTEKYGPLMKLLLWGKRQSPAGYAQFGPIAESQTAKMFYRMPVRENEEFKSKKQAAKKKSISTDDFSMPKNGWFLGCFAIQSAYRRKGLAVRLGQNILRDLKKRGVKVVDAYPLKKGSLNQNPSGPVALYEKLGFKAVFEAGPEHKRVVVMRRKLS